MRYVYVLLGGNIIVIIQVVITARDLQ